MLYRKDILDIKKVLESVENGSSDEKELINLLRENAKEILDMAERSTDLECENDRLKFQLKNSMRRNVL